MHHQCIVLSISELQRIDDLCINAVIYAGLESSCSRFGGLAFCESSQFRWGRDSGDSHFAGPHNFGGVVIR